MENKAKVLPFIGSKYIPCNGYARKIASRRMSLHSFRNVAYKSDGGGDDDDDDDEESDASGTGLSQKQFNTLVDKFASQAEKKLQRQREKFERELNKKYEDMTKGLLTAEAFNSFKTEELTKLNDAIAKIEGIAKTHGDKINEIIGEDGEGSSKKGITIEDYMKSIMPKIKELRQAGTGIMVVTSEDLRKAGVKTFNGRLKTPAATTIGNTIEAMTGAPASPYLPGLGGSDLELFDIIRNPNFITNRVDVGRTNQQRLAWINETVYDGTPGVNVLEGGTKPLIQHKFKVEFSEAKKAAAHMIFSEEFEDDLPGLATALRRMLQSDVMRSFDDQIQTNVIAIARPYEITGLNGKVPFTTLFDAIGAMIAQVGFYNFVPNTVALNSVTAWQMLMDKDAQGRYLNPPFMDRLNALLVEANKITVGFGLVGDLTQYKVDIYKDFTLRIGWINDQFINNLFTVVGELRYHSYISDTRKKAIVYNSLLAVQQTITAGS